MGTEDRLPPEDFLAENPTPYEYIVFRATEVKDLAIEKNPPTANHRSVHDDPAVLGVSKNLMMAWFLPVVSLQYNLMLTSSL